MMHPGGAHARGVAYGERYDGEHERNRFGWRRFGRPDTEVLGPETTPAGHVGERSAGYTDPHGARAGRTVHCLPNDGEAGACRPHRRGQTAPSAGQGNVRCRTEVGAAPAALLVHRGHAGTGTLT